MRIIHRYLLGQFVKSYIICFCSLTGLYIVVDGFSQLDSFLEYAEQHGQLGLVIARYYFYRSLAVFDSTSAVISLIAAMFTVTWIQRHNELTAILAAGISKARVIVPIIVAVIVISLLTSVVRETVIPDVRDRPGLARNAQDLQGDQEKPLEPLYDQLTGILFQGRATLAAGKRILQPDFQLPNGLNRLGRSLMASEAAYLEANENHPSGYLMNGVSLPEGITQQASLYLEEKPVVLTPRDTHWLQPDQLFVVSDVTFEQLSGGWSFRQYASTAELVGGLHNASMSFGGNVRVAVHARFVQPLLDVTLLFLGLPWVLSSRTRNVFLAVGICTAVVVAFMATVLACHELGHQVLISASLAAWLPLFIFVPIAAATSEPVFEWRGR